MTRHDLTCLDLTCPPLRARCACVTLACSRVFILAFLLLRSLCMAFARLVCTACACACTQIALLLVHGLCTVYVCTAGSQVLRFDLTARGLHGVAHGHCPSPPAHSAGAYDEEDEAAHAQARRRSENDARAEFEAFVLATPAGSKGPAGKAESKRETKRLALPPPRSHAAGKGGGGGARDGDQGGAKRRACERCSCE